MIPLWFKIAWWSLGVLAAFAFLVVDPGQGRRNEERERPMPPTGRGDS